jgi:predicted Zn-dependent protease
VSIQGAVSGREWLRRMTMACTFMWAASPAWAQSDGSEASLQGFQTMPARPGAPAAQSAGGPNKMLTLHSDLRFGLLAAQRQSIDAASAPYQAQVKRVAARLQAAAKKTFPDAQGRAASFDVFVADTQKLSAISSGSGKIAVSAGFAAVKPDDAWLAFVIAREMAHVISGHHDSNAGASIAVSVAMNFIIPGSGLIKSALSFGGSELASGSRREEQGKEADLAAMKLLAAAGYPAKAVLRSLQQRPLGEEVSSTMWAADYRASVARLAVKAPPKAPAAPARRNQRAAPPETQAQLVSWRPGDARRAPRAGVNVAAAPGQAAQGANRYSLDACSGCWASP